MSSEWIGKFYTPGFYQSAYENTGVMAKFDSRKQAEQIVGLLGAKQGSHILDWCGGWGRISLELLRLGYSVTLLDFCQPFVCQAIAQAQLEGLPLKTVVSDFRETPWDIKADFAINIFTAGLGHLGKEEDIKALRSLHTALKPGASFLIDTMSFSWIARNFLERGWQESGDGRYRLLERRSFDFLTNTIQSTCIYEDREERKEEKVETALHLYTPAELTEVLWTAGFSPIKLFGGLDGSDFSFGSKRIVLISQRQ